MSTLNFWSVLAQGPSLTPHESSLNAQASPFVSVSTAPPMDVYTSVVAPLLLRGARIHRAAACPEIVNCDLDLLVTAPGLLITVGVGDVLGKYSAKADWLLVYVINDEPY